MHVRVARVYALPRTEVQYSTAIVFARKSMLEYPSMENKHTVQSTLKVACYMSPDFCFQRHVAVLLDYHTSVLGASYKYHTIVIFRPYSMFDHRPCLFDHRPCLSEIITRTLLMVETRNETKRRNITAQSRFQLSSLKTMKRPS